MSLYQRFCQLDRNAKGFISADEFLSVPEFAMNPLSQVLTFFALWPFRPKHLFLFVSLFLYFLFPSPHAKVWRVICFPIVDGLCACLQRLLKMVDGLNFKDFVAFLSAFSAKANAQQKIERTF